MKKITMIFHKDELFNEFMDIAIQTEDKYGINNFNIVYADPENNSDITINVINKV